MPCRPTFRLLTAAALLTLGNSVCAAPRPLPTEPIPASRALPPELPRDWVLVHDVNSAGISEGRIVFVDIGAGSEVRAQVGASFLANYQFVPARHELYVAETFYSRGQRGVRSDVITIYDTRTMIPTAEIALPTGKRGLFVPDAGSFQLINEAKWGLVFNFTPAASVSVVDLVSRKVLSEIEVPGCSMIYPLDGRNFGTLCGDGTMLSIALDELGNIASTQSTPAFNDIDNDAMFMRPAMAGQTAWFVTFKGKLQPVELAGPVARPGAAITLAAQPGGTPEWRPGGKQIIAADTLGRVYVLMNPNGAEGSHKDGGTEVWLVDPRQQSVIRRIPLAVRALSIAATQEAQPKLAVIGFDRTLRVYDPETGILLRALPSVGTSPLAMVVVP